MEATCILKAFVTSAKQYFSCEIEPNFLNLQRHLEIIAALALSSSSHEAFEPTELIAAECFTCFVELIIHHSHKTVLIAKVLPILQSLAKKDNILKALQSTFHLHAALALFLQQHDLVMNDPWVLQCLHLLEIVTQDIQIPCIEHHLEYLINSFLAEINNKSPEVHVPVLHILSNLCRQNPEVQTYICCLPNIKQIVKSLASKLCYPVEIAIIYSLSLLANLMMNTHFGEKVFTHKRAKKGLELIVILLTSSNENSSVAALNLFLDMTQISQCLQFYTKYDKLDLVLQKVAGSYHKKTSPLQAARYLKFLWIFASIPECTKKVSSVLYIHNIANICQEDCQLFHPLLSDYCVSKESGDEASLYAIKIIRLLVEFFSEDQLHSSHEELKCLVQNLIKGITSFDGVKSDHVKILRNTQVELLDLLTSLCHFDNLKPILSGSSKIVEVQNIITNELEWNVLTTDNGKICEDDVDLLLSSISLMGSLNQNTPSTREFLDDVLEDSRLICFIATSLTSSDEKRVNRGLYVISALKPDFSLLMLSESISLMNNKRGQFLSGNLCSGASTTLYRIPSPYFKSSSCSFQPYLTADSGIHSCFPGSRIHSHKETTLVDIDTLLKKVKNGLKLQELKSSEIIELYEHEIASLTMKEKELENLVHSKSAALHQADRVLIQYKCSQAQKEVETLKLRQLLKESEKRSEIASDQYNQALGKCAILQDDLKSAKQELNISRLQIEKKEEVILDLNERINQIKMDHDKEQKHFTKLLKEKESEMKDLLKKLQDLDEQLKRSTENYQTLEGLKSDLQNEMEELERNYEKQQKEMKLLEMVCQQHEANLKDRDTKIKSLTEELEKHKLITGMIHEISSGKANMASLLTK